MSDSTSKMLLVAMVEPAEAEVVVVEVDPEDAKVVIDPDAEGEDGGGRISSIAETMPFTAFFIRPVIITKGLQSSA